MTKGLVISFEDDRVPGEEFIKSRSPFPLDDIVYYKGEDIVDVLAILDKICPDVTFLTTNAPDNVQSSVGGITLSGVSPQAARR